MSTLSVDDALGLVVQEAGSQPIVEMPLGDVYGLVLAEMAVSDVDSPPFPKSLVDGFAIQSKDFASGEGMFRVLGEIAAGDAPGHTLESMTAYQIMTGAPIPDNADSVIMRERSVLSKEKVYLLDENFRVGQHVLTQGRELSKGEVILEKGSLLGSADIGVLASIGCTHPKVYQRPTVAVLATGNELVSPETMPELGKIRNSNESLILAQCLRSHATSKSLGIAPDDPQVIAAKIREGLESDILVLTGGVSVGNHDYVPEVLQKLGVQKIFHGVAMKPGKPIWFGKTERGSLVFGLPGNPVSALVGFELFVRTAIRARQKRLRPLPLMIPAELTRDFSYKTDRITYHPARLCIGTEQLQVAPIPWCGSPDLRSLCAANALLVCPPNIETFVAGSWMQVLPYFRE